MNGTAPVDALAPIEIQVNGLHKSFGDNVVLQGIDLTIRRGETLAIVGGSGCGKTVLLNHILGKLLPDQGHVRVVDHGDPTLPLCALDELDAFAIDRLHQHWGVVFQRNALFSGSVYDNIALWLQEVRQLDDDVIIPIARRSLAAVGLDCDDEFLRMDHLELSGGMAKRLAIARAIAMEPVVLFYDEPTTGLDPASSAQIHQLIQQTHDTRLAGGIARTSVIITHDKDLLLRLRPRTVMLHEGRVLFDGAFAAFERDRSEVIRPYFDQMPVLNRRAGAN